MNVTRRKRRSDCRGQLLRWRQAGGTRLFIGNAEEPAARANAKTGAFQPNRSLVERKPTCSPLESRFGRYVANKVITVLIVKDASDPPAQVIRTSDEKASGLVSQIIKPVLGISKLVQPPPQNIGSLLPVQRPDVI